MSSSHRLPSLAARHSPSTTDHFIDSRQDKHAQDAFISSQLVELGLLGPPRAVGKRSKSGKDKRSRGSRWKSGKGKSPGDEETVKEENSVDFATTQDAPRSGNSGPDSGKTRPDTAKSHWSKGSINDLKNRAGAGASGMLDSERRGTRRERTFVGTECAVCEEPLEHTLRGERILQFSCGHVSHGACFYEYMKEFESQYCPACDKPLGLDTTRGGNVLDIEKIGDLVRNANVNDREDPTPTHSNWTHQTTPPPSVDSQAQPHHDYQRNESRQGGRDSAAVYRQEERRDTRDQRQVRDLHQAQQSYSTHNQHFSPQSSNHQPQYSQDQYRHPPNASHKRGDSDATGHASSNGYPETNNSSAYRRHDYDTQVKDTSVPTPRSSVIRNPIPAPHVTVRAEFPTLNKSRIQQTLTCLVTIEVPDNGWRPHPDDLCAPPLHPTIHEEDEYNDSRPPSPAKSPPPLPSSAPRFYSYESPEVLDEITQNLRARVENWHGLDFSRFGKLRLYGTIRVGKDKISWQELECYLFSEMLICVKEKKGSVAQQWCDEGNGRGRGGRCTLKGSILIKKHLLRVTQCAANEEMGMTERITERNLRQGEEDVLTLSLSVAELPQFHLQFGNPNQLKLWHQALANLHSVEEEAHIENGLEEFGHRNPHTEHHQESEDEDWRRSDSTHARTNPKRVSSLASSNHGHRSNHTTTTANTECTSHRSLPITAQPSHVPVDIVVVVPLSSSMQGVKMSLVRDALSYLVNSLGALDRLGIVTFGASGGGVPVVGMTGKVWGGWGKVLNGLRPVSKGSGGGGRGADGVEGASVAMDLLMGRKTSNPIATILVISDAPSGGEENVDFVVSRAEAAKIPIHTFGLGLSHTPTPLLSLSTSTKGTYTYIRDWMTLRECLAGVLGALQSTSHLNVKLRLRLPEGSPAKFVKISGALAVSKRATGRDAEATIGDLRWGEKRDVLVQLAITPDAATPAADPPGSDPWDSIMSSLEALSGPLEEGTSPRPMSVEEVPLLQAGLSWNDVLRENTLTYLPRPSLLTITMLPAATPRDGLRKQGQGMGRELPVPPHPSVVQRRMELLTSDMLSRALTLVGRGQHERAAHLLTETRSILKGLGRGGLPLPSAPPPAAALPRLPPTPATPQGFAMNANRRSPQLSDSDKSRGGSPVSSTRRDDIANMYTAPLPPPPGPPPLPPMPITSSHFNAQHNQFNYSNSQDSLHPNGSTPTPSSSLAQIGGAIGVGGIDQQMVAALDAELEAALEWIGHPAVFARDSRKQVLQATGVIASQRAFTSRSKTEEYWALRVRGVKRGLEGSEAWGREGGGESDEGGNGGGGRLEGVREES